MTLPHKAQCAECGRVFDLLVEDDAQEWWHGHDCEPDESEEERDQ